MNPWALLVILLGIVLIIVGIQGTQHNITSAITGHPHGGSNYPQQSPSGQSPANAPNPSKPRQIPVINPGAPLS